MKKHVPLVSLGLSQEDCTIYEQLLKCGPLSPTALSQKTKFFRTTVYSSLESLRAKNLIIVVPHGKRSHYQAQPPRHLKELLKEQEESVLEEVIRLETITKVSTPYVRVLSGEKGITSVYDEITEELRRGDVYYRYQSIDTEKISKKVMSSKARSLRNAKQLERYVITSKDSKHKINAFPTRYVKSIPDSLGVFNHGVAQFMYGNKTAIIDYPNQVVTIIENKAITDFQIAIFKALFHYI
jgi:sugar-specific transcriptional regulator TrmB